jgi:hypothetical protein
MLVTSLLNTDVGMMPLAKVTDMRLFQTTLGRSLGYAHFIVESAGQDQALSRIDYVPFPSQMYRQILSLLFEKRSPGGGRRGRRGREGRRGRRGRRDPPRGLLGRCGLAGAAGHGRPGKGLPSRRATIPGTEAAGGRRAVRVPRCGSRPGIWMYPRTIGTRSGSRFGVPMPR